MNGGSEDQFHEMGAVLFEIFRGDVCDSRDGIYCDQVFAKNFKTPMASTTELQILDCVNYFNYSHLNGAQILDVVSLYRTQNEAKCKSRIDRLNTEIPDANITLVGYKLYRERDLKYRMTQLGDSGHLLASLLSDLIPLFEPQVAGGILDVARYIRDHGINQGNHVAVLDVIRKHEPRLEAFLQAPSVVQLVNLLRASSHSALRRAIERTNDIFSACGKLQPISFEDVMAMRMVYRSPESCAPMVTSWRTRGLKRSQIGDSTHDDGEICHGHKRLCGGVSEMVGSISDDVTNGTGRNKLLILDLNKVLICRHKRRRQRYFVRPYAAEFVGEMSRIFGCIAVWTSGRQENVASAVRELFGGVGLLFFWTQQQCTFVKLSSADCRTDNESENQRVAGGSTWNGEYKKELSRVWAEFPEFSRRNTVGNN
jgi:hypothetical protein